MHLVRFGPYRREKPGVLLSDGSRRDCSSIVRDYDAAFWGSPDAVALARALTEHGQALPRVPESERWGAPITRPGKLICVGLNYSDHARESGMEVPAEPLLFMKATNTVVGPFDDILIPRGSEKTDWEVELGVVIGKEALYLDSPATALSHVAGYAISHDVSERAFQLERGGQWSKGKSCDTFNPLGPALVTPDQVADPQNLGLWLDVNGERRQSGSTRTMVFGVDYLVYYISQFMRLEPGDLINTGTPPGVGLGMKPPVYLREGDVVELGVEGLGRQRSCIRKA
jgi:2-keto-4-pentenoate hydratase/2-oxohepta-3-ene-1,7-dioic acid hydratase in catechol pathway